MCPKYASCDKLRKLQFFMHAHILPPLPPFNFYFHHKITISAQPCSGQAIFLGGHHYTVDSSVRKLIGISQIRVFNIRQHLKLSRVVRVLPLSKRCYFANQLTYQHVMLLLVHRPILRIYSHVLRGCVRGQCIYPFMVCLPISSL